MIIKNIKKIALNITQIIDRHIQIIYIYVCVCVCVCVSECVNSHFQNN